MLYYVNIINFPLYISINITIKINRDFMKKEEIDKWLYF